METQEKPFIKLLKSPYGWYFFDVNRNQIVSVSERNYQEMKQNNWDNSDGEIQKLRKLGYLSAKKVEKLEHPVTGIIENLL